jgi:hypothetical protein
MSMNRLLEQCILFILVLLGQTAQAAHTYQAANAWVEGGVVLLAPHYHLQLVTLRLQ